MRPSSYPQATYRIQLNSQLKFKDLQEAADYFHELGVSHLYLSPILKAKKGSSHCYDVTDPTQLNPDIGTLNEFEALVTTLHSKSLGILLDIVPNHMYVGNDENPWWNSVLEKGERSPFANFFDINWHPPKSISDRKIFLPLLDQLFGIALEDQKIKLSYDKGRFVLYVRDLPLPTETGSWPLILEPLAKEMKKRFPAHDPDLQELNTIIKGLCQPLALAQNPHLDSAKVSGNSNGHLAQEVVINLEMTVDNKTRLQTLFLRQPIFLAALSKQLENFNGIKGNPSSFNRLEAFLNAQHYRISYWRVANEEINYRRFFDLFEYASLRIENEETFKKVHELIFDLVKKGWINGLRVDHIDGLWNPQKYLEDLTKNIQNDSFYLVVEKILIGNEKLRSEWPVNGTVGYDFLNQLNGLFIYQPNKDKLIESYQQFTGQYGNVRDLKYQCKKLIINSSLASELHILTLRLNSLAERHRHYQDFTFESLNSALSEIIACFPVYRSYIETSPKIIHEEDCKAIHVAIAKAMRHNCSLERSVYAFIQDVLFFQYPEEVDDAFKEACQDFVMHFQQVTSPVMAKGLEDTAFYRCFPLCSVNEVGGDPGTFGISLENFHKKNLERFATWPQSLLATTTHDTKRSEDFRARVNLLSEIPDEWNHALNAWSQINHQYKTNFEEETIPSANEEYLLYQTLLGSWPFAPVDEIYIKRIQTYMKKAIKEAKIHSSWINPNNKYDFAVSQFIQKIFKNTQFIESFTKFSQRIFDLGMLNSLSQLILKLTAPGIPDIYQGSELWDFRLVDPDNRNRIDFSENKKLLSRSQDLDDCLKTPRDGRIKLFVTQKILQLRSRYPALFSEGIYLMLKLESAVPGDPVIAYARIFGSEALLVISTRFPTFFMKDFHNQTLFWSDAFLKLPPEMSKFQFKDIFTGHIYPKCQKLALVELFSKMPFAVLTSNLG